MGFDKSIIQQFKTYKNKPYIILKLVDAIIRNKELIGKENFKSLFDFFKNYIEYYKNSYKRSLQFKEAYIRILLELNTYDEAEKICLDNIQDYPKNPHVYNTYANFQKNYQTDISQAEKYYRKAIELDNYKTPYFLNNLAKLYIDWKILI